MDQIQRVNGALGALKVLRSSVGHIFETLAGGVLAADDAKYLVDLQEQLNAVTVNLRDVEATVGCLQPPQGMLSLGNSSFLSQEVTVDRQSMYPSLVKSYRWIEKVKTHSQIASTLLSANILKRSYTNHTSRRRRKSPLFTMEQVDQCLGQLERPPEVKFKIWRPFGNNAVLLVTLGRAMKVALIFRGLITEWIVVKGFNEPLEEVDDLWSESRYEVMQRVRDHMHSAMLHFFSPAMPEVAVRSLVVWVNSYLTLFSDPCKRCGKLLQNSMPPTWRDFRSLEPYHDECRH